MRLVGLWPGIAMVTELVEMGKGAEMKPAHRVLLRWCVSSGICLSLHLPDVCTCRYMPLVDEITAEQRKIKRNVSGMDRRQYGGYLLLLPPEKLAVIVLHEVLGMALAAGNAGVRFTRAAIAVGQAVRAEINLLRLKKDKAQFKHWCVTHRSLSSHGIVLAGVIAVLSSLCQHAHVF